MKRNILLLILLILMLAATGYLVKNYKTSTINEELSDFAVDDTSSIDKIFLADKQGNQVTLTRQSGGHWNVNGETPARMDAVNLLLYTIKAVEVRSPVGRYNYNQVIKLIATNGVKVEIYQHGKLVKTYYVGGGTQDHLGTFMYLENSTVPFVTHIPGFNGFLTPRYFTAINKWKERSVFHYPQGSIRLLTVTDKENSSATFTIKYNDTIKDYELYDANNQLISNAVKGKLESYLDFYADLSFEGIAEKLNSFQADSLEAIGSFLTIDIKDINGKTKHVNFIRKPVDRRTKTLEDEKGNPPKYDMDRMLTRIDNDTALVTTQYILFQKLFQSTNEFIKDNPSSAQKN